MANRIDVKYKIEDTRAGVKKKYFETLGLSGKINEVTITDSYTIDKKLTSGQLKKVVDLLTNPLIETSSIDKSFSPEKFEFAVEIGFLPGVTDNVGHTAKETIEDGLKIKFKKDESVYSSQVFYVDGSLTVSDVLKIAESLFNPLIQRAQVKSFKEFIKDRGMGKNFPKVILQKKTMVAQINLNISDDELSIIGKNGINGPLALDLHQMKTIQKYFKKLGRAPTDVEIESLAQTWSEHCQHTIFNDPIDEIKEGLYKKYIKGATTKINKSFCISVFTDNSGAIEFDENYLITDKVETHNTPSALDPFGGALTGIVGVNRDTLGFGLGAKPIINKFGFCFADPAEERPIYRGPNRTQKMLSPKRIMEGVIEGVKVGGNCSGIPTPQGFLFFDDRFRGKPLVFVGTIGIIPKKIAGKLSHIKRAKPGDYIVMIGGRVGIDGIHGATFSSEAMDMKSPTSSVQIGDPITQKNLSDALINEARDAGLYNAITDNGAGGLSSSVGEMAKQSNGCIVELDKVPLKYEGMNPWQIWISESQERMTLAIPAKNWKKFAGIMKKYKVEATIIGKFTSNGKCTVKYKNQKVMDIDLKFLHEGRPQKYQETDELKNKNKEPFIKKTSELTTVLTNILSRPNIASFEFISMQFDHEVQGQSILKPLQGAGRVNSTATVTRPLPDSKKGIVLSSGINPSYSDIDTYHMAACAIDTAIRNAIAVGADLDHLALLDNFCWGSSDDPVQLGKLKKAVRACYDFAVAYGTPFISGKDSMFNDFKGYDQHGKPLKITVPETLLISTIGVIDDVDKTISLDAKFPGDLIYILGETFEELGGSEYYAMMNEVGISVPKVNAIKNKKLYWAFQKCVSENLIASSISVARGGLAVALSKMSIGGLLGVDVSLKHLPGKFGRDDFALFSESQGRILVTIASQNQKRFEKLMSGNKIALIGKVTADNTINIKGKSGKQIVKLKVDDALWAYKKTFSQW